MALYVFMWNITEGSIEYSYNRLFALSFVFFFFLECAKQQLPLKGELMQTEDRYRKSVIWNTKQKEHKEYRMNSKIEDESNGLLIYNNST